MLKKIIIGSLVIATSAMALPAYACGMHGGGFGFGNPNASWESYNPRSFTTDPALLGNEDASLVTPMPAQKARPSFSNVANRAALLAKSRMAKKAKDKQEKTSKEKPIQKAALDLNADR